MKHEIKRKMSYLKTEWLNILNTKQSDISWVLGKYTCPRYMFAGEYDPSIIKQKVLKTHRIKDAIHQYINSNDTTEQEAYSEAEKILDEIAHTFGLRTIRFMAFSLMKILRSLFQSVLVNKKGIEMFRECVEHTPIVLVPTHNSYFDFLLASVVCFALNLPLPAIVAGQDFLGMAIINHLLRQSGAFYMRRSFASDGFYRSIFTEYVQQVLTLGERPIEFFPEGTRSRCGKCLQPKLGLLSMVLESFFHGFVQDVHFIPISISYEKITEEQLYLFELLGIPKPKESLSGLVKARKVLQSDFGNVIFHIGDAMSLRKYCYRQINSNDYIHIPRCERHLNIFGRDQQEMKIAKYFGEKIILHQQSKMVIFPRFVVAAIMLNHCGSPKQIDTLCDEVDEISKCLKSLGCLLYGFDGLLTDYNNSIKKAISFSECALTIKENIVTFEYDTIIDEKLAATQLSQTFSKETLNLKDCLAYVYLSCQRNRLLQPCCFPSLLTHCLLVDQTNYRSDFLLLCRILRMEFICDPDLTFEQVFDRTLVDMIRNGFIINEYDNYQMQHDLFSSFLTSLMQAFIDAYMLIAIVLLNGSFMFPMSIKNMSMELQLQLVSAIRTVNLQTYEALSLHTLSNAITAFCKNSALKTVKNKKFETLVDGIDREILIQYKKFLGKFVSTNVRLHLLDAHL